jgi:hypothetical protein
MIAIGMITHGWAQSNELIKTTEDELTRVYQETRSKMNTSQRDQLKRDEVQWIKKRDANEAKSKNAQEVHIKMTRERIVELQKIALKQNNSSLDNKGFYNISDKFPKNSVGIKVIGKLYSLNTLDTPPKTFLVPDTEKGERDIGRRFEILGPVFPEHTYLNFTEDNPMVVKDKGILGQYYVTINNSFSKSPKISNENLLTSNPEIEPLLFDLYKSSLDPSVVSNYKQKFKNPIKPLNGYMNIPWGTEFKDVALGGRLDYNKIKCLKNYALLYEQNLQSTNSPLVRMQRLIDLDNEQNDLIKSKGMSEYPILPDYGEVSFANNSNNQYINYYFCDSRLYAVDIGGFEINKSNAIDTNNFYNSLEEQTEVYTRAFVHKYGNPKLELKKSTLPVIGEVNYITETWSNDCGTVVMVLISHKLEADIGRFLLDLGKSYVGNKINESLIGGTTAADSIKSTLDSLSDTAEDKLKDLEKMFTLSHITYYSKKYMDSSADYLDKFEQKRTKDIEDCKRTRDNEMNAKANKIMDKI